MLESITRLTGTSTFIGVVRLSFWGGDRGETCAAHSRAHGAITPWTRFASAPRASTGLALGSASCEKSAHAAPLLPRPTGLRRPLLRRLHGRFLLPGQLHLAGAALRTARRLVVEQISRMRDADPDLADYRPQARDARGSGAENAVTAS